MQRELMLDLTVHGEAAPAGSKTSNAVYRKGPDGKPVPVMKDGRVVTTTRDASAKSKPWKQEIAGAALEAYRGEVLDEALEVEIVFHIARKASHFGTGRNAGMVKDGSRAYPSVKPDVDKLSRAVLDALTGIVWRDDSRVIEKRARKVYDLDRDYTEIRVWRCAAQRAADLPMKDRVRGMEAVSAQTVLAA